MTLAPVTVRAMSDVELFLALETAFRDCGDLEECQVLSADAARRCLARAIKAELASSSETVLLAEARKRVAEAQESRSALGTSWIKKDQEKMRSMVELFHLKCEIEAGESLASLLPDPMMGPLSLGEKGK
jgi:hypothetical protein